MPRVALSLSGMSTCDKSAFTNPKCSPNASPAPLTGHRWSSMCVKGRHLPCENAVPAVSVSELPLVTDNDILLRERHPKPPLHIGHCPASILQGLDESGAVRHLS